MMKKSSNTSQLPEELQVKIKNVRRDPRRTSAGCREYLVAISTTVLSVDRGEPTDPSGEYASATMPLECR
jgi:hypothetical protein